MSSSNLISALGAGSGVDTKSLAQNLMEVERAPRKDRIDAKIAKSEARISGYGAIKYALSELKTAFDKLKDTSDFTSLKVVNSQSTAVSVTTSATADAGTFSLEVTNVALPQRSVGSFATRSTQLNGNEPFWLKLNLAGTDQSPIEVTTPTPAGIVSAINGAKLGVTAQIIETGSNVVVVLTGPEGDVNDFTLTAVTNSVDDEPTTTALTDVDFSTTSQVATDAVFFINGQQITRSNNRVSDALEGVTIELFTATSSAARIEMQRETAGIQERLQGLVTAYNDFNDALKILGDRKSEVESFGGALAGDSILSSFRAQIRDMVISTSSTPGDTVQAVRHVGLSLDRFGVLTLDSTKLETALEDNFEEVVTMLTGNTDNQSVYNPADAGVAGDASKIIEKMLRSTGQLAVQTETAGQKIEDHQAELVKLEARMQKILERYIAQFSVMDNIVGNSNSVRTNLQSSFDGMAASYSRR